MAKSICFLLLIVSFECFSQQWPPYPERHRRLVQSVSFAPDGTLYFTLPHREYLESQGKTVLPETPRLVIYSARWDVDHWTTPQIIEFGGRFKEYEPTVSPDGKLMFFNSNRPVEGEEPLEKNSIWYSKKINDRWSEPEYIPAINTTEFEESYATITKDGQLFFVAEKLKADSTFEYAVYTTKFEGKDTKPASRVTEIDKPQGSADPWVAPNGSYIIFTKFGKDWSTTCDLYIAFKEGRSWSKPMVLKDLNSEGPDYAVAISPDEKWLYYRTNRQFLKVPFQPVLLKAKANRQD